MSAAGLHTLLHHVAMLENQNALRPAGVQAEHIAQLWNLTLIICTIVFCAVLAGFFIAVWRGTRRAPHGEPDLRSLAEPEPALFRNVLIAVLLSSGLLFVLIGADFFTSRALADIPLKDAVHVELTSHQWWWEARYTDDNPAHIFSTANELHIPVGTTVIVKLRSADVIHSFWVPNLHGKKDLLPGQTAYIRFRADRPGDYRGQCAEFCGFEHALMALDVIAEPQEQFAAWVNAQRENGHAPSNPKELRGQEVFLQSACASCHAIQGTTAGAVFGPDLTHVASRPTLAAGTLPNDAEHLKNWILDPGKFKRGVNMPANPLPPDDLEALVAYLETLK